MKKMKKMKILELILIERISSYIQIDMYNNLISLI
jgi:hypothetical protein